MRLTVLGTGTVRAEAGTPASGLLVETARSSFLLDCGLGIVRALLPRRDPRTLSGVVIGHLHADHYLDLVPLRYLFPWAGRPPAPLPVFLPPGGHARLTALAGAVSERECFFEDAFDVREYEDGQALVLDDTELRFQRARHYVPAWSVQVAGPDGARLVYLGDTGPRENLTTFAADADLLVCEATLASAADDDEERGHLTVDEAIAIAAQARVGRALLVHYPGERRAEIARACAVTDGLVEPAVAGMTVDVRAAGARPAPTGAERP